MANLITNNMADRQKGTSQGNGDRIISLLGAAVEDLKYFIDVEKLKSYTDAFDSVKQTMDRSKTSATDNAVKMSTVEEDAKKEKFRHDEAMANIELEYKKITDASAKGELQLSMVQGMVQSLVAESSRINSMDDSNFLTPQAQSRQENLHRTMIELSKELLKG